MPLLPIYWFYFKRHGEETTVAFKVLTAALAGQGSSGGWSIIQVHAAAAGSAPVRAHAGGNQGVHGSKGTAHRRCSFLCSIESVSKLLKIPVVTRLDGTQFRDDGIWRLPALPPASFLSAPPPRGGTEGSPVRCVSCLCSDSLPVKERGITF